MRKDFRQNPLDALRESLLMEDEFSPFDVSLNTITRQELSFQQRKTQRVEQAALNDPLERARSVYRVVALFGQ